MNWKEQFDNYFNQPDMILPVDALKDFISKEIIENMILELEKKYMKHTWTSEADAEFIFHKLGQLRDKWL